MAQKYYTADITWCDCGCTNTKCDCHISNLDPLRGSGMYSVADRSKGCTEYRGKKGDGTCDQKTVR